MAEKCEKCGFILADGESLCPECRRKRKSVLRKTVSSFIFTILLVAALLTVKYLKRRSTADALGELLVTELHFPKGSVVVRHLDGDRYGVFVYDPAKNMTKPAEGDEPAFVMVANEKTRKFEFASDEDKDKAFAERIALELLKKR